MGNVSTTVIGNRISGMHKTYITEPGPNKNESQEDFIGRCVDFFRFKGEDQLAAKKRCNILWDTQWEVKQEIKQEIRKPKILLISDVKDWAWWNKSEYIKKYLSDQFDIDLFAALTDGPIDPVKYDLYLTFGFSYIDLLRKVPYFKKITGVTAHRPLKVIEPQMKKAYATHANSILLLNELKTVHSNVFYVPNGVDEELFNITTPIPKERDNIIVGHVGKMFKEKGQVDFIIPAIEKAGAESMLHTANHNNDMIKYNEMPLLYNKMDVFVVASIEDGTPNPALEAAACGRPIISNAIGNMPQFIKDGYNGFIVERDVDAYVEKIEWLRNHRDKMIEMGYNARKTIEKEWTWKLNVEAYRRMFNKILDDNGKRVSAVAVEIKNRVPKITPVKARLATTEELEAFNKIKQREKEKNIIIKPKVFGQPTIVILVDVVNWAWDVKAHQIQKYLSKDFDVHIRYSQSSIRPFNKNETFDLYFSFDCNQVRYFNHIPKNKKITGTTSHTYTSFHGNYTNMLNSTKYVHANSMLLYNELSKIHPNVFYVPNGVDEELFLLRERNLDDIFRVGYVGKNTVRKGYENFIVPACKQAEVELKAQVCRFNSPNVIKPENMPNWYNDIDCYIVASDMDGTPNGGLQSAACGRMILSNRIGNMPEFIKDGSNGFIIDRNVNDYVEKLNWLKTHRKECEEMGLAARKTVEEGWTWKTQVENYGKMFEEALKG